MSIAFCFLTYDEITRPDIWEKYFENIDENKYNIYVHPKIQKYIKNQKFFNNKIIPTICDTEWGTFSLIEAQHLLFMEALKISSAKHFILVSHNTIPIQSFNKLYNYLNKFNNMSIINTVPSKKCHIERYKMLHKPIFSKELFLFQSQWCILSRQDVTTLTSDFDKIKNIFEHNFAPDEHVYINYLLHYKHRSFIVGETTYVARSDDIDKKDSSNKPIYQNNVQLYYELPIEFIKNLKKNNIFFLRKISRELEVNIDELFENNDNNLITI